MGGSLTDGSGAQPDGSGEPADAQDAKRRGWAQQLGSENFSLRDSVGGVRGVLESLLPGLLFVIVYVATRDLRWTLIASGSVAAGFVLARLVQRTPVTQAFAGLLGVGVGVAWAAMSGRAENYFAWGIITNAVFLVLFVGSIAMRRSLISVGVQAMYSLPSNWRSQQWGRPLARRCTLSSWVWAGVFGARLVGQVPLYLSAQIAALGTVKLVLGLPLFALATWATWVLLRSVLPDRENESQGE